jgi:glycosyltransferase involved in cell wall biosynthesis
MATGIPAVASDLPGIREAAGEAACLVPAGDAAAWAHSLRRLIQDAAERRRLSTAGREQAARFTAEHAAEVMEYWLYQARER